VLNGFGLRTLSIYGQFRNKIIFYPVIEGAYVNTKNWYREETDLWAELGKSTTQQEVFLKAFGKGRLQSGVRHHSAEELFHAWKKKHSGMRDDVA
jgi:hypothetical protein